MAAKSILKDAKAPLHLLRIAALSAARPSPVSYVAAATPPTPLADSAVLRRSIGSGSLWAVNSELFRVKARGGSKPVVDEESEEDDEELDISDGDLDDMDDDEAFEDEDDEEEEEEEEEEVGVSKR